MVVKKEFGGSPGRNEKKKERLRKEREENDCLLFCPVFAWFDERLFRLSARVSVCKVGRY